MFASSAELYQQTVRQIFLVYDCWAHCAGDRTTLTLMPWPLGYEVSLERLRQFYENTVEQYLQRLTHRKTDQEDIRDEVSRVMILFSRKLKHTPDLAAQRRKNKENMKQFEWLNETILDALAIADPEGVTEILSSFLANAGEVKEALETPQRITAGIHDVLTLPNLREVIQGATDDQWEQAREDYLHLCQLLGDFGAFLELIRKPERRGDQRTPRCDWKTMKIHL